MRVAGEARALLKCLRYVFFWLDLNFLLSLVCRSGVNVPGLRYVDATEGLLGIEWIEGKTIKYLLPSGAQEEFHEDEDMINLNDASLVTDEDPLKEFGISVGMSYLFEIVICIISHILVDILMDLIGVELAKMHIADIIHGDLTTSNMMLQHPSSFHPQDETVPTQVVCPCSHIVVLTLVQNYSDCILIF